MTAILQSAHVEEKEDGKDKEIAVSQCSGFPGFLYNIRYIKIDIAVESDRA